MRTRQAYHHGNLREALIDAGVALLGRQGIDAVTLRNVVAQAGVSPAAAYRHFSNATELLSAIAEKGFVALRLAMVAALADPRLAEVSPIERIGQGYVRFAQEHPDFLRLIFSPRIPCDERSTPLAEAGHAAFGVLIQAIEQARAQGDVDAATPTPLLAVAAWSIIHGLTVLLLDEHLDPKELGLTNSAELAAACMAIFRYGWSDALKGKKQAGSRQRSRVKAVSLKSPSPNKSRRSPRSAG